MRSPLHARDGTLLSRPHAQVLRNIVFTSGRSGPQQIYRMNMDGADLERLTDGTGEAGNPSWHPDGQITGLHVDPRIRHRGLEHIHHGRCIAQGTPS